MRQNEIEIFGVRIAIVGSSALLSIIDSAISDDRKITIAYANAHTLNECYENEELKVLLNSMDYIHPDGIGIYKASKYLYGCNGLTERFTGSDFYPELVNMCIRKKYSIFFFGHSQDTLAKIKNVNPSLRISGTHEGYDFKDADVLAKINESAPDILIIGLSFPIQEEWISKYRQELNCNVIMAVGDGIKVFSGEKKRGPKLLRALGLEWLTRVVTEPERYFVRYSAGIPKFMMRVKSLKRHKVK